MNANHDRLAYPLVASVPTASGFLLLITYFESGGLCIKHLLDLTFNKLDMDINQDNFIFSNLNPVPLFTLLILIIEAWIRLSKNWIVISETIKYTVCWWNRRNTVHPASDQPSSVMLRLLTFTDLYKLGPLLMVALGYGFIRILLFVDIKTEVLSQVMFDCALLALPIYWVISSDDICDFIKLKINQNSDANFQETYNHVTLLFHT